MSTITGARRQEIVRLQDMVEDELQWVQEKEEEVKGILAFIQTLSDSQLEQVTNSASGSRGKRGRGTAVSTQQAIERYERSAENLEALIAARRVHIANLQAEKEGLENFEQGV